MNLNAISYVLDKINLTWLYLTVTARKRSLGQGNIFTPVCHSVHRGGMRGCSWGGGMCGCSRGAGRGCAWLLQGGVHGFIQGACVVLFGGCVVLFGGAWFYLGGVCGFIQGACVVLFGGACMVLLGGMHGFIRGEACVVFSVFSDTMTYGQWVGSTHPTGMHSYF